MKNVRHGPAFTLVEVLLALAIGALLVAVTGRIATQTLLTRNFVQDQMAGLERGEQVFALLDEDFSNLLKSGLEETPAVNVYGNDDRQVLELTTLSALPDEQDSLHLALRPCMVRYRLAVLLGRSEHDGLVRELIDRTQAGAQPIREVISQSLERFEVEVFVQGQWKREPGNRPATDSDAVRVTLHWKDNASQMTRTFVLRRTQ